ncbi:MAG: hypothetical protein D6699_08355 [Aquificota bacterium]|nr:MAG: hypothetical protein D6699_08355 [Aquificota bacterium]
MLYLKKIAIYEELLLEAERLLEEGCERGNAKSLKGVERVISSLEAIASPEPLGENRLIASKRLKKAGILLNETKRYAKKHPTLYAYQLLFYHVARENLKVKDYEYALKYSFASYNLGRAILELR